MPLLPSLNPLALDRLDTGARNRLDIAIPSCTGITFWPFRPVRSQPRKLGGEFGADYRWQICSPLVKSYILCHSLYQEESDRTRI